MGALAAKDVYEIVKKFITKTAHSEAVHDGIEAVKKGAAKAKQEVDEHILHKTDKVDKKEEDAEKA
jgi:hypothetical protein